MNQILIPYVSMADMLVETLGKSCEVVLHDLNRPEHSVVYVAGDVTHRKPGQNFDHLVKEVMLSDKLNNNYVANYYFEVEGKLIRSSTQLILTKTNSWLVLYVSTLTQHRLLSKSLI
ncbi:two-component response regulator involved in C4-dicarboxylate transport [Actinobacillus equuli]|nr:two-component response regulator involved in C4-dicarboxylate transport [Actinobacillus equuli]